MDRYAFTERELKEIEFATMYFEQFDHGTPGHTHLVLIAKLSAKMDRLLKDQLDAMSVKLKD